MLCEGVWLREGALDPDFAGVWTKSWELSGSLNEGGNTQSPWWRVKLQLGAGVGGVFTSQEEPRCSVVFAEQPWLSLCETLQ